MSNNFKINETTICKYTKGSKSKSDFHSVTIRFRHGLGGIQNDEIELVENRVKKDFEDGLICAATLGVEGLGEDRHLHVSMILAEQSESHVTQKRYQELIDEGRLDFVSYMRDTILYHTCAIQKMDPNKLHLVKL